MVYVTIAVEVVKHDHYVVHTDVVARIDAILAGKPPKSEMWSTQASNCGTFSRVHMCPSSLSVWSTQLCSPVPGPNRVFPDIQRCVVAVHHAPDCDHQASSQACLSRLSAAKRYTCCRLVMSHVTASVVSYLSDL